ncbi:MAG: spore coat associated protein CotJA [Clostridia bacterium]|nr:spore coat associated protein CotJA [Clostridia bacterium]
MSPVTHENSYRSSRPLAMVYAEKQEFCSIYDPEIALINGTIFEELNLPFYHSKCSRNGGCSR